MKSCSSASSRYSHSFSSVFIQSKVSGRSQLIFLLPQLHIYPDSLQENSLAPNIHYSSHSSFISHFLIFNFSLLVHSLSQELHSNLLKITCNFSVPLTITRLTSQFSSNSSDSFSPSALGPLSQLCSLASAFFETQHSHLRFSRRLPSVVPR